MAGGGARGVGEVVALAARDIKLSHSVFALPFAIVGAFLAGPTRGLASSPSWGRFAGALAIVVACMVGARTWAMLVNRLADRRFDAENQRTAGRAFASGKLSARQGWVMAGLSAAGFVGAAGLFWALHDNPWPLRLSPLVLAWIGAYSYTKRFTALCHVHLGASLAMSPLAAAIAVDPDAIASTPSIWWIAAFVLLWVAGFDVLYALQDIDFDRGAGLHSIPARVGPDRARAMAAGLHACGVGALLAAWTSDPRMGALTLVATGLVGVVLVGEHVLVARRGREGIPMAFLAFNGVVSVVMGAFAAWDAVW